eukprot:Rhum_TRINITY_DN20768_c0_g1::Rhum_TRINITY_DN20768_c0_g1_i1::g.172070::m.172070
MVARKVVGRQCSARPTREDEKATRRSACRTRCDGSLQSRVLTVPRIDRNAREVALEQSCNGRKKVLVRGVCPRVVVEHERVTPVNALDVELAGVVHLLGGLRVHRVLRQVVREEVLARVAEAPVARRHVDDVGEEDRAVLVLSEVQQIQQLLAAVHGVVLHAAGAPRAVQRCVLRDDGHPHGAALDCRAENGLRRLVVPVPPLLGPVKRFVDTVQLAHVDGVRPLVVPQRAHRPARRRVRELANVHGRHLGGIPRLRRATVRRGAVRGRRRVASLLLHLLRGVGAVRLLRVRVHGRLRRVRRRTVRRLRRVRVCRRCPLLRVRGRRRVRVAGRGELAGRLRRGGPRSRCCVRVGGACGRHAVRLRRWVRRTARDEAVLRSAHLRVGLVGRRREAAVVRLPRHGRLDGCRRRRRRSGGLARDGRRVLRGGVLLRVAGVRRRRQGSVLAAGGRRLHVARRREGGGGGRGRSVGCRSALLLVRIGRDTHCVVTWYAMKYRYCSF